MKTFLALIIALLAPALHAAPVTWSVSSVSGPSDVLTTGTPIGGMNVGGNTQTINGVDFAAEGGGAGVFNLGPAGLPTVQFSFDNGFNNNLWTAADPGSAAYNTALDTARYADGSSRTGTVTLGSLSVGRKYIVQLWIVDTRGGGLSDRIRTVDGATTIAAGPNIATGTFTADAFTQVITIAGTGAGSHGPQVNMLQLREAPVTTVVTNLTASSGRVEPITATNNAAAHAFTTGNSAFALESVFVRMTATTNGSVRLKLWSGSGGVPTTLIEDLGEMTVGGLPAFNYSRSSVLKPVLAANTRYWVSVHHVSGSLNWQTTSSPVTTAGLGTLDNNEAFSTNDGTSWNGAVPNDRHLLAVTGTFVVTTAADTGPGSLRQALADAANAANPGPDTITFAPGLTGGIINLTDVSNPGSGNTALVIADAGGVTIDASALPGGITLNGAGPTGNYRLIQFSSGTHTLRGLTLANGGGSGFTAYGGAIANNGANLTLERCNLRDNRVGGGPFGGGAILNNGGALALTCNQCTFSGNSFNGTADPGSSGGGAVNHRTGNPATFTHCTFSGNTTNQSGGAILAQAGTNITLTNTIVAGNTATAGGPDIWNGGTLTANGKNLLSVAIAGTGSVTNSGNIIINATPLLSTLGNYGGPTKTMPPMPGSPARDAATIAPGLTTDQRGAPLPGSLRDIGAVEAGGSVPGLSLVVTTAADEMNGVDVNGVSLREAVTLAPAGGTITFAAPLDANSVIGLSADLAVAGVTLNTAIAGGSVDVAVNADTLSFGGGSLFTPWTGGGQILLGDTNTNSSADATVEVNGPHGFTLAAPITVRGNHIGAGLKKLRAANSDAGTNTFTGAITLLTAATVEQVNGSAFVEHVEFAGPMELGAHPLTVNANDEVSFSGSVGRTDLAVGQPGTAQLVKNDNGYLYLLGNADNPRLTATVNAGNLNLVKASNVHALGSGLPAGTTALTVAGLGNVIVGSGISGGDQIADTASVTVAGSLVLYASETLDALTGSGTVFAPPNGNYTLTLGSASGSHSFDGSLDEPPGNALFNLSLTKTGAGTQTVAGGSMGGTVQVNGGTLNVTGSLPNVSSSTVASGATLAGSGTVNNLTLESGSFFAPGNATVPNAIGTLTVGLGTPATWHGGATARFHLSNTGNSSDKLAVPSGALTKAGSGSFTFDFQNTGAPGFIYTLATFASSSGFDVGNFSATNLGSSVEGGFFTLNADSLTYTTYSTVVSSAADSGPGTLRNALATVPTGSTLTFTTSGPITLSSELIVSSAVTLDATSLPSGLTISGNNATRLFLVTPTGNLTLRSLTLTGGNGTGASFSGSGGAIFNRSGGTLALTHCTLSNNTASLGGGGAIYNTGTLALTQSTLTTNRAGFGGAISNAGSTAAATLTHCTLTQNEAAGPSGISGGGAIDNWNNATLTLNNCILAGNTTATATGPDLWMENGSLTATGVNFIGNTTSSTLSASGTILTTAANGAVNLAPLGNYGGPTQTMPPLFADSPALDAASNVAGLTTDQRGAPLPGTGRDIGAVELGKTIVTTTADENNGIGNGSSVSLREALTDPAPFGSELITFAPALNGATISLTINDGFNAITVSKRYSSVDASSLPAGLTIDDGTATNYRLFSVNSSSTLAFHSLTLANGGGADFFGDGGAIYNFGTLMLTQSTLSGNQGEPEGGAISNFGTATLTHCTLASNTADSGGGAIFNSGPLTLTHCTLSGNTAQAGGGIQNNGPLTLTNTLIAGNTATLGATNGPDIRNLGTITRVGVNLVQDLDHFTVIGGGTESGTGSILAGPAPLAGLAYYGGPTQTMPPLPGSPAIDPTGGATTSPFPTDQRGLPRLLDGNAVAGPIVDIGAVEYDRTMVLTLDNTGPGSLRDTFTAAPAASILTFAPLLSGGTIPLTSEIILSKAITLDASALPAGLIVDGVAASVANRLFTVNNGQSVTLKNLTLTGGTTPAATNGGAVLNNGTLTLTNCTLNANTTSLNGGAIANQGTLTVNTSTLFNNTAPTGNAGAIWNAPGATLTLTLCTFAGNSAPQGGSAGGAIRNEGTLALTHCTFSGNSSVFGGGIYNDPGKTATITNSIFSGSNPGGDIRNFGTVTGQGTNLIPTLTNSSPGTSSGTILTSNPLLAPLGNYGGPTQTMALLPGSPARNAATGSTINSDQRGFSIIGTADIGAYEAGTFNSYTTWIWETLPTAGNGTLNDPLHATTYDYDGDGQSNVNEWLALTNPANGTSRFFATPVRNGANLEITVPTAAGRTYTLLQSATLQGGSWTAVPGISPQAGTGSPHTFQVPIGSGKMFFQARVSMP